MYSQPNSHYSARQNEESFDLCVKQTMYVASTSSLVGYLGS
jgi:hypothetical protein